MINVIIIGLLTRIISAVTLGLLIIWTIISGIIIFYLCWPHVRTYLKIYIYQISSTLDKPNVIQETFNRKCKSIILNSFLYWKYEIQLVTSQDFSFQKTIERFL